MSYKTDAKKLKEQLEAEGFEVTRTGSGHYEVRHPTDPQRITNFPQTPGDHRWRQNTVMYIKRWKREHGDSGLAVL